MRKESSNFLGFLFSLLILLFIRDIQARKLQQKSCFSSCGDIKKIRYPFRLKDDPIKCGDADFELSCHGNKTILEFQSGKYYVKRISYSRQIITVVDAKLANGSCGLASNSLPLRLLRSDHRYWVSQYYNSKANFVRCSRNISENTYRTLFCPNNDQSYVFVTFGWSLMISDLPKSCSFISTVPTSDASVNLSSDEAINKLLQSGFHLRWSYNAPVTMEILTSIATLLVTCLLRVIFLPLELLLLLDHFYFLRASYYGTYALYMGMSASASAWVVALVLITRFVYFMVLIVLVICKYKATKKTIDDVEKFLHNQQSWMPKRYSYIEIIAITNHFRDKLGQGGFGTVYKAQLLNGSLVAVKVLENSKFSGEEFINEVSTIGRIHHSHVVRLVGFSSEGSKRALVYEYMPNGSLDRHIFSKKGSGKSFSWEKLHEIAIGIARGIEYLHNGCDVCILHFDIKPHNILLNHNFVPKVADFGLAKFYPKENNFICVSATRGTIGYIAPELVSRNFGAITCKSDVYSFGMLLLEMSGGRRNSFAKATRSSKAYFPSWVYDRIIERRDLELQVVSEIEEVIARKLCIIGLWCIQVKAVARPSITKVVEMLEGNIDDLQMPPKPCFSSSPQCNSIREIQSDSSTELLQYSGSTE